MNYQNYETSIVEVYHVKLVGWPEGVPFGNPSTFPSNDLVRLLKQALEDGECKWIKLTERQQKEHRDALAAKRKAGVVVGVKRKTRSDKGGVHNSSGKGRRKSRRTTDSELREGSEMDEEDEDEEDPQSSQPLRKSLRSQLPSSMKSKKFIDESSEEEDTDGDERED